MGIPIFRGKQMINIQTPTHTHRYCKCLFLQLEKLYHHWNVLHSDILIFRVYIVSGGYINIRNRLNFHQFIVLYTIIILPPLNFNSIFAICIKSISTYKKPQKSQHTKKKTIEWNLCK